MSPTYPPYSPLPCIGSNSGIMLFQEVGSGMAVPGTGLYDYTTGTSSSSVLAEASASAPSGATANNWAEVEAAVNMSLAPDIYAPSACDEISYSGSNYYYATATFNYSYSYTAFISASCNNGDNGGTSYAQAGISMSIELALWDGTTNAWVMTTAEDVLPYSTVQCTNSGSPTLSPTGTSAGFGNWTTSNQFSLYNNNVYSFFTIMLGYIYVDALTAPGHAGTSSGADAYFTSASVTANSISCGYC